MTDPTSRRAAMAWAFFLLRDQTEAVSPNVEAFAFRTASSTSFTLATPRTGPKISSRISSISSVAPSTMVGGMKSPAGFNPLDGGFAKILAPFDLASRS